MRLSVFSAISFRARRLRSTLRGCVGTVIRVELLSFCTHNSPEGEGRFYTCSERGLDPEQCRLWSRGQKHLIQTCIHLILQLKVVWEDRGHRIGAHSRDLQICSRSQLSVIPSLGREALPLREAGGQCKAFLMQAVSSRRVRFCIRESMRANKSCPGEMQTGWNPWLRFFPPFLRPVQLPISHTPVSKAPIQRPFPWLYFLPTESQVRFRFHIIPFPKEFSC